MVRSTFSSSASSARQSYHRGNALHKSRDAQAKTMCISVCVCVVCVCVRRRIEHEDECVAHELECNDTGSYSSSSSSLVFQVPSFVHVGSPMPPCWVASLLGPCGLGHRLHSLCRWICTFRPSLYHSILSGFKNGRTGYGMWCPWRAFGSWTPLIRPLWGLAGSL